MVGRYVSTIECVQYSTKINTEEQEVWFHDTMRKIPNLDHVMGVKRRSADRSADIATSTSALLEASATKVTGTVVVSIWVVMLQ